MSYFGEHSLRFLQTCGHYWTEQGYNKWRECSTGLDRIRRKYCCIQGMEYSWCLYGNVETFTIDLACRWYKLLQSVLVTDGNTERP
jgi:hypothetical protein